MKVRDAVNPPRPQAERFPVKMEPEWSLAKNRRLRMDAAAAPPVSTMGSTLQLSGPLLHTYLC